MSLRKKPTCSCVPWREIVCAEESGGGARETFGPGETGICRPAASWVGICRPWAGSSTSSWAGCVTSVCGADSSAAAGSGA